MSIRYRADYAGTGEGMRSPEMQALVRQVAEKGMAFAVGIAPVGGRRDPHPGEYKAAFEVQAGIYEGAPGPRAQAALVNTADHAADVEWRDGHKVLTRTLGFLESL